jgi:hypothetical protein
MTDVLPKAKMLYELAASLEKDFEIDLQLLNIGETEHNKKGNRFQKCTVTDGTHSKDIKVYEGRNGMPLGQELSGEWLTFSLSARSFKGNTYIGGFWQSDAPKVTGRPQSTPQTPQKPLQPTNDKPDWDAIAEGKVRHGVVCAFIAAGKFEVDISIVEYWVRYIMDGQIQVNEPVSQETCPQCHLLRIDCTCPTEPFVR